MAHQMSQLSDIANHQKQKRRRILYRNDIFGRIFSFKQLILILMLASLGACGGGGNAEDEMPSVSVLDLASLPATGQTVSPGEDALFEITSLTPGIFYSVSIAGTNGIHLRVFNDPSLVSFLCESHASSGSGNCSAAPTGTSLFLRVRDSSRFGDDTFTLDVIVAPPPP